MNRLCITTCGLGSWRERLANPDRQWKRRFSALETAVSWERASRTSSGLPEPILKLFRNSIYCEPVLMFAIAEHKVPLAGGPADSQCDVWAFLNTKAGTVSLSIEAKAQESFGKSNQTLEQWLDAGKSERARTNRQERWNDIKKHLPNIVEGGYSQVAYQLLHRCAAAVIEAKRFRLENAAFVVQAFQSPAKSFDAFSQMCRAMATDAERGRIHFTKVGDICLGIGWADCLLATDQELAAVV